MTTSDVENRVNSCTAALLDNPIDFPPLPVKADHRLAALQADHVSGTRPKLYSHTITLPIEEQRRPAMGEKLIPGDIARSVMRLTGVDVDMSSSALTRTITMVVRSTDEGKVREACKMLRARLAIPVRLVLRVPMKALGAIVGKGGRSIKAVMQETGARIAIPEHRDEEGDVEAEAEVCIEGSGDACTMAKARIEEIAIEAVNHVVEHVDLSETIEYFVCGPNRKNIAALQTHFACIKLTHSPGKLVLSGNKEQVREARDELIEKVLRLQKEIKQITTLVPKHAHKHLVGTKGNILHAIEESSSCLVVIPPADEPSDLITIYGLPGNLVKGLQMLMEKTEAFHEEPVPCPFLIKSFMLHKHRDELRAIEKEFAIQIRQEDVGFVLVGKKEDGERARVALKALIQGFLSLKFDTLSISNKDMVRHVVGKRGQGLHKVEQEFNVDVVIEEGQSEHLLLFVGDLDQSVAQARAAIATFIEHLENEDSRSVDLEASIIPEVLKILKRLQELNPDYSIRFSQADKCLKIRGPKGDRLDACASSVSKHICDVKSYISDHSFTSTLAVDVHAKTGLSIRALRTKFDLPSDLRLDHAHGLLTIKGTKRDVDHYTPLIKAHLERLADQLVVAVPIAEGLMGRLIGKGGKNIQSLYDQFTQINIRFEKEASRVTLSGPSKTVEACALCLKHKIDTLVRTSKVSTVSLPPPAINRLLAKQAQELNELQQKYAVKVFIKSATGSASVEGEEEDKVKECIAFLEQIASEEHEEVIALDSDTSGLLSGPLHSYFRHFITANVPPLAKVTQHGEQVRIRGRKEQVQVGKDLLVQLLHQLGTTYTVQVICVDQRFHGQIIGQRGANIKKLMQTFDVAIDISKGSDDLVVAGRNVEGAIDEILRQCSS